MNSARLESMDCTFPTWLPSCGENTLRRVWVDSYRWIICGIRAFFNLVRVLQLLGGLRRPTNQSACFSEISEVSKNTAFVSATTVTYTVGVGVASISQPDVGPRFCPYGGPRACRSSGESKLAGSRTWVDVGTDYFRFQAPFFPCR